VPALVVAGEHDPLLAPADAGVLAEALGAEIRVLVGAGHWPLAGPMWQGAVDLVHRWVVQTLGEPLLELHAETMAEREEEE
jgi:pimeloyl-ACP methyl ester carboxylesterase